MFGGHRTANYAEPRQDVSRILGRMPKVQVETRQEAICYIDIMTSESSSEQARPHTVWHGHRTPLGTGPLRGGSKLAFFGSRLETAFSGYMSIFSVPGSCLMQVQYLNDGGLASFSSRSQA